MRMLTEFTSTTSDLLTQTETRNSWGACLKHSKTKSKSFTRRCQTPDDNSSLCRFWLIHPCDRRTELRWLRRAIAVAAVARKNQD